MDLQFFDIELGERDGQGIRAMHCNGVSYLLLYYMINGKRTVNLSAISRKLVRCGFEKVRQIPNRLVVLQKGDKMIAIDSKGRIRAVIHPIAAGDIQAAVKSTDRFLERLPKELGVKDVRIEPASCLSPDAFLDALPELIR